MSSSGLPSNEDRIELETELFFLTSNKPPLRLIACDSVSLPGVIRLFSFVIGLINYCKKLTSKEFLERYVCELVDLAFSFQ